MDIKFTKILSISGHRKIENKNKNEFLLLVRLAKIQNTKRLIISKIYNDIRKKVYSNVKLLVFWQYGPKSKLWADFDPEILLARL